MKCLIVSPCGLPVPAVKGGAVLTLIESLIKQNEFSPDMKFSIISSYDKQAEQKSSQYKNTNFIFIKEPKILNFIDNSYEKICKFLGHTNQYPKRYAWKIFILKKIQRILKEENYDRIILENSGYLLKSIKNKKLLEKYKNKIFYHIHNDIPKNIDKVVLKQCYLLLISKYLERGIVDVVGEEILDRCKILKNGFDCNIFKNELSLEEKRKIKQELNIEFDKKIILYTGRIIAEKGILELIKAFENIKSQEYILLIIGSHNFGANQTSDFEQNLKKKMEALKENIRFTGYVNYLDIWKYYKIADLAVLPSVWEEPAGLTMLEATVSSVPLITTRSGGIPEYLSENQVTLIKRDENISKNIEKNIIKIFENYKYYKKIAKKSSEFVEANYNEKNFYENFINCIK